MLKKARGGSAEEDVLVEAFENRLFRQIGIVNDLAVGGSLARNKFLEFDEKAGIFGQNFSGEAATRFSFSAPKSEMRGGCWVETDCEPGRCCAAADADKAIPARIKDAKERKTIRRTPFARVVKS